MLQWWLWDARFFIDFYSSLQLREKNETNFFFRAPHASFAVARREGVAKKSFKDNDRKIHYNFLSSPFEFRKQKSKYNRRSIWKRVVCCLMESALIKGIDYRTTFRLISPLLHFHSLWGGSAAAREVLEL